MATNMETDIEINVNTDMQTEKKQYFLFYESRPPFGDRSGLIPANPTYKDAQWTGIYPHSEALRYWNILRQRAQNSELPMNIYWHGNYGDSEYEPPLTTEEKRAKNLFSTLI